MRTTGKLDYLEFPATGGSLDRMKNFYAGVFGWSFTDYGPTYAAFDEGIEGGLQADPSDAPQAPLPVIYSADIEETFEAVKAAGMQIRRDIFDFPGGRRFHFADPAGNEIAVWSERNA